MKNKKRTALTHMCLWKLETNQLYFLHVCARARVYTCLHVLCSHLKRPIAMVITKTRRSQILAMFTVHQSTRQVVAVFVGVLTALIGNV